MATCNAVIDNRHAPSTPTPHTLHCVQQGAVDVYKSKIDNFDKSRRVFVKQQISPVPFDPPQFFTYILQQLLGTVKVTIKQRNMHASTYGMLGWCGSQLCQ